jgi:hypothetical protein
LTAPSTASCWGAIAPAQRVGNIGIESGYRAFELAADLRERSI